MPRSLIEAIKRLTRSMGIVGPIIIAIAIVLTIVLALLAALRHIVLRKTDHVGEPRSRLGVTLSLWMPVP